MLLKYEDIAVKVSDYFATALQGDWEESKSKTFTFDQYHPSFVHYFVNNAARGVSLKHLHKHEDRLQL